MTVEVRRSIFEADEAKEMAEKEDEVHGKSNQTLFDLTTRMPTIPSCLFGLRRAGCKKTWSRAGRR